MNRIAKMDEEKRESMTDYYKELLQSLNLDTYTTSRVISRELNMDSRTWRMHVENIMHLYMYNYLDKLVIGTPKGYLLTGDKDLIEKFLAHKEHQFKSLAYNCYNLTKAIKHKDNMTIEDFVIDSL